MHRLKPAGQLVAGDLVVGLDGETFQVGALHHVPGLQGMVRIQGRLQSGGCLGDWLGSRMGREPCLMSTGQR